MLALKTGQPIYEMRGYRDGYRLAREPDSINLYEIYCSLEGELDVYPCVSSERLCPNAATCATHMTFGDFNEKIISLPGNQMIGEIVHRQNKLNEIWLVPSNQREA